MEELLKILYNIRPEIDFKNETNDFLENNYLDSFDIITLVTEIEEVFSISINGSDISPDNFNNLEAIIRLIKRSGGRIEL